MIARLLALWLISVCSLLYLTSYTKALYNDIETISNHLHAQWEIIKFAEWDKSSLDFDPRDVQLARGATCDPPYIFAEIYNDGETMTHSVWSWELFRIDGMDRGQPNIVSGPLDSGIVASIEKGGVGIIESHGPLDGNGKYVFIVTKPEGRPGNPTIRSEIIVVDDCEDSLAVDEEKDDTGDARDPKEQEDEKGPKDNKGPKDDKGPDGDKGPNEGNGAKEGKGPKNGKGPNGLKEENVSDEPQDAPVEQRADEPQDAPVEQGADEPQPEQPETERETVDAPGGEETPATDPEPVGSPRDESDIAEGSHAEEGSDTVVENDPADESHTPEEEQVTELEE